ncbi:hypothetical protein C0J52_20893 [Blattella germanica]|nr:hypothetical protein C0J52_20893 [Blattella germanica]
MIDSVVVSIISASVVVTGYVVLRVVDISSLSLVFNDSVVVDIIFCVVVVSAEDVVADIVESSSVSIEMRDSVVDIKSVSIVGSVESVVAVNICSDSVVVTVCGNVAAVGKYSGCQNCFDIQSSTLVAILRLLQMIILIRHDPQNEEQWDYLLDKHMEGQLYCSSTCYINWNGAIIIIIIINNNNNNKWFVITDSFVFIPPFQQDGGRRNGLRKKLRNFWTLQLLKLTLHEFWDCWNNKLEI